MTRKVLIIGSGIIGLTTGLLLIREGKCEVKIISKEVPPYTTSNMAGAFWYPVLEEPERYMRENYIHEEEAGCVERMIDTYYDDENGVPHPDVEKGIPSFSIIPAKDVPPQIKCLGGFSFLSYVSDTNVYLNFLVKQFKHEGGLLEIQDVNSIADLNKLFQNETKYDAVINCTGLGAEGLFGDHSVYPIRGQTILVDPIPGRDRMTYIDSTDPSYIIPRKTDCVLGGTYQFNNNNLNVDEQDTKNILQKASIFGVIDPIIKQVRVGLRPGRPSLRLEKDLLSFTSSSSSSSSVLLIHNYGHGSRGFTLSWGCAFQVLQMLNENK